MSQEPITTHPTTPTTTDATGFDDLMAANRAYGETFDQADLAAPARAGVAVVTCMDSRIDPLALLGLGLGDAKVLRNPGGRVTDLTLQGIVLAVNLLGCRRVMVVEHTKCAVAGATEQELRERVAEAAGADAGDQSLPSIPDQDAQLRADVDRVLAHPLVADTVEVGGFIYDVDTGILDRVV